MPALGRRYRARERARAALACDRIGGTLIAAVTQWPASATAASRSTATKSVDGKPSKDVRVGPAKARNTGHSRRQSDGKAMATTEKFSVCGWLGDQRSRKGRAVHCLISRFHSASIPAGKDEGLRPRRSCDDSRPSLGWRRSSEPLFPLKVQLLGPPA